MYQIVQLVWVFSLSFVVVSLLFFPGLVFSAFLPAVVELSGLSFFATFFFHFILLFWNQVFTCASFRPRICDNLARFVESKYLCSEKVFSRTRNWRSVKTVRDLRHLFPLGVRRAGFTRKYTGRGWCIISELEGGSTIKEKEWNFIDIRTKSFQTASYEDLEATNS